MKKFHLSLILALLCSFSAVSVSAGEAEIKKAAESFFGERLKIDGIKKTSVPGLYEIQAGPDVFYMDEKGQHLIIGDLVEVKSRTNLTEERKNKLSAIKFSDLPLNLAIKQVRGNGKRVMASFEDPNCGYCKKLNREMQSLTDVTIYTFVYPILSQDSFEKGRNIMCAPDQAKAWNDWMVNATAPPAATGKCDGSLDKLVALGQKLNVRGTPNIFLADGTRIPGAVPLSQLESRLSATSGQNSASR